jgi:hypothetical protein
MNTVNTKNTGQIIPFCIYHRNNSNTQTYLGFISGPRQVFTKNGTEIFECAPEPKTYRQWFLYSNFYALAPSFRPIPVGMLLFCAKRSSIYPYDITEVKFVYDPFNLHDDCIYFIVYSQPMVNTVPLYLHKISKHIYPSFDKNPPSDDPAWTHEGISPIFVMTKNTVGDIDKIKFRCVNGRCIPWVKNMKNVYDSDYNDHTDDSQLMYLDECALICNKLKKEKPLDIFDMVKKENIRSGKYLILRKILISMIILILCLVFLVFLVLII